MDHNFSGDPLANTGYWSPQTSAANFCEIDYNVSHHIAEFINTLSNLAYVYQAIATLPPSLRHRYSLSALWQWPVESWALILVGIGSGSFHLTLRHHPQILDESAMYFITGALDFRLWSHGMSDSGRLAFGTGLSAMIFGVIGWNMLGPLDGLADNKVHLMCFIGLLTALWPRGLYMIKRQSRERREKGLKGTDETARRATKLFRSGVGYFFSGFLLWLLEGRFCHELRYIRSVTGMPLGWLLELHGWWHIFTAIGAGRFVRFARELTKEKSPSSSENGVRRI